MTTDKTSVVSTSNTESPETDWQPYQTVNILLAMIKRLQTLVPAAVIDVFSGKPDEYSVSQNAATVLVGYGGSKCAKTNDTGLAAQPRKLKFFITVFSQDLTGFLGTIELTDAVIQAFEGWMPPHCQRMLIVKDFFAGKAEGVYRHIIKLNTQTMLIQKEEKQEWPVLKKSIFEGD